MRLKATPLTDSLLLLLLNVIHSKLGVHYLGIIGKCIVAFRVCSIVRVANARAHIQ